MTTQAGLDLYEDRLDLYEENYKIKTKIQKCLM